MTTARSTVPFWTERRSEAGWGFLFIAPVVIGFLVFVFGPMLVAVGLSFTNYEPLSDVEFVGLDNFVRMLSDKRLQTVYANTSVYVISAVVFMNGFGLVLAYILNRRLPRALRFALRSAYFFPSMVALAYVAVIFQFLFQLDGVINYYLGFLGIPKIN